MPAAATDVLRVGLDLTPAVVGTTGVMRYATALHHALRARDALEVRAFAAGRGRRVEGVRQWPVPLRVLHPLWRTLGHPRAEAFCGTVDVVHSLDLLPPPCRAPLVVTLLDVLPATHPEYFSDRARRDFDAKVAALPRAALVVVAAAANMEEVARVAGVSPARLRVVPLAGGLPPADGGPAPVEGSYVLALGAVTARKGLDVLAEAAERLTALLGDGAPRVVVAGPDGPDGDEVRALLHRIAGPRIRVLGEVDDVVAARLVAGALAVVHPSHAEGFGLVPLEAMAAGTPVVAADIPTVREVTAGTATLVPPGDADALADAVAALVGDPAERTRMAAAGRVRAASFGWDATAAAMAAVYAEACR